MSSGPGSARQYAADSIRKRQHYKENAAADERTPIVGDARQRVLKPGEQAGTDQRSEQRRHDCEREGKKMASLREPVARPYTDDAVRAAGYAVPLKRDRPCDLRERKRQHRQIDARQPDAEPSEYERGNRGAQWRECHRE